jgi:hypothetical protein
MDLAGFDKLSARRPLGVYSCELALPFDSSACRTLKTFLLASVTFRRPNACDRCTLKAVNGVVSIMWHGFNEPFACRNDIYRISLDVAVVCLAYAAEKPQAQAVPLLGNLGVVHVASMTENPHHVGYLQ